MAAGHIPFFLKRLQQSAIYPEMAGHELQQKPNTPFFA